MATYKCRHCDAEIRQFSGKLWHDKSPVFPQYCVNSHERQSQRHEPIPEIKVHSGFRYFYSEDTGRWIVDGPEFYCAGYKSETAALEEIDKLKV